jgi:hypothetical protein
MSAKIWQTRGRHFSEASLKASDCRSLASYARVKGDEGTEGGRDMQAIKMACYKLFRLARMHRELGRRALESRHHLICC